MDLHTYILELISKGTRFRWENVTSDSGAVISKGLGSEYRFGIKQKKSMRFLLSKNGVCPMQLADVIFDDCCVDMINSEHYFKNIDSIDILNEILSICNSYNSIKSIKAELKRYYSEIENVYSDIYEPEMQPDDAEFLLMCVGLQGAKKLFSELSHYELSGSLLL